VCSCHLTKKLDNLVLFLAIIEREGLSAAGRELGLSPATVSERLAALEAYYGATLMTRTTRSLSLTEEGRVLAEGAQRLLAEADELESRIRWGTQKISGPVRLTEPSISVKIAWYRSLTVSSRLIQTSPSTSR
jgi:DNA-binding transcriptional LysR family regulator